MPSSAAASGPEGLGYAVAAEAEGRPFELVILDMQMPGMDGVETARRLQSTLGTSPLVVMLTSVNRDAQLREQAAAAGVHTVLYKPTKPSALHETLVRAFGEHQRRLDAAPPDEQTALRDGSSPVATVPGASVWISRADRPRGGDRVSVAGRRPGHSVSDAEGTDGAPAARGAARVLLAEDNAVNQKVALRLLGRPRGYGRRRGQRRQGRRGCAASVWRREALRSRADGRPDARGRWARSHAAGSGLPVVPSRPSSR